MSVHRCGWCEKDELYIQYHDREWGVPVHDERTLFEFLILETMQAGLSWHTVLRSVKRFVRHITTSTSTPSRASRPTMLNA